MPAESLPLYSDDDADTDTETQPTRSKPAVRRRISEINPDDSFSETPNRPTRAVNMNDDAAEKRRRRKSTKLVPMDTMASLDGTGEEGAESSRTIRRVQTLNNIVQAPIIAPPIEIQHSRYEEWMKLATDNKINAGNSWGVFLIDYFHDMSLLRNTGEQTINFQRASCTLDGCVKIWTSRVDSVGTETAKLASNLAGGHNDDEDDDEAGSDNENEDGAQPKKRKTHRAAATLAKDPAQLRSKKLDLEFSVDPLFRKTCADFDEGGASGLLMNHLSLGIGKASALRVIFDASDSIPREDEDEDEEEPYEAVDLSHLRTTYLPTLDILEDKAITHSLEDFAFANDANFDEHEPLYADNTINDFDGDDGDDGMDGGFDYTGNDPPPDEDFFQGENAIVENYGPIGDDHGAGHDDHSNGSVGPSEGGDGGPASYTSFDPTQQGARGDFILAPNDDGGESSFALLDKSVLRNWAGPEHFKRRAPLRRVDAEGNANKTTKGRKEKKEPYRIDFLSQSEKSFEEMEKELFATVAKGGASINLPKKKNEKRDNHTLPDDMHFSSKQLIRLFLKPTFELRTKRKGTHDDPSQEMDAAYWAKQIAERDQEGDNTNAPFNTQFFQDDDYGGGGFDDDDGDDVEGMLVIPDMDPGEQDLLVSTQGPSKRVRPQAVAYSKRAKRVDVRKLKENIWKNLDIITAKAPKAPPEDESMDVDDEPAEEPIPTDPEEARVFGSVLSGLQKSYPQDKMDEISTSFCFICLLHLANEQGLKIDASNAQVIDPDDDDDDDEDVEERRVGNIFDIKVFRDPNATQAS